MKYTVGGISRSTILLQEGITFGQQLNALKEVSLVGAALTLAVPPECNALLGQEEHHRNNAMEIQSSFFDLRCTSSKYLLGYIPMDLGCLLTYPGHHGSLVKSRLLMFPKRIKSPLPITIASGGQAIFICPILRFAEHPTAKTEGSTFGYRIFKPFE